MNVQTPTILLVDDDPLDLMILEDLLLQADDNNRIIKAESAPAALELIRGGAVIHLLLMDICMPGVDGAMFLRQLAELKFGAHIILVSSLNTTLMHSIGELGLSHGLNLLGFIHKPVVPHALKTLMGRARPTSPSAKPVPVGSPPGQPVALDVSFARLSEAIGADEIRPWYQPKLESGTLRLVGVEALARWQLPDGAMISPAQFIPAIESHRLADALFDSMLRQVLDDLARWRAADRFFKISVNLSMDSAHDLGLPDRIDALLDKYIIPADQLIIEVTESRLMSDKSKAIETLSRISLKGIALSIDDFGTGYSGLSQLAALPFAELKIDGSFVQRASFDSKAMAILKSTVTFGRSLGMEVVAEGVETIDQLDMLRSLGAGQMQGYLIARPMSAQNLEIWLANWRPGLATAPGCTRPYTVLIVDDSKSMRMVIEAEMSHRIRGVKIIHAENGQQALEIAARASVDAATIDYHMPGMNGIELINKLRNMAPASRYVLLTAELSEAVAKEAVAAGALYLPKPLSPNLVARAVQHFMDN